MNTPTTPTPDLEGLRKAVQEFQPNPHRVAFSGLRPVHDSIAELRKRKISYTAIADLLQQHGVKTSRARVAEYGRIVLDGGRMRRRRKRAGTVPAANIPPLPQSVSAEPAPATTTPAASGNISPPPKENAAYVSRGPRIARVEQLPPDEAREFLDSLKPGNGPKP